MAGNNVINYDIKFNADTSNLTSQVNQLKTSFQELKSIAQQNLTGSGSTDKQRQEYQQLLQTINAVDTALTQAFNKDLGTLNVAKFNQSINSTVGGIQNVGNSLNSMGAKGQQAFKKLSTELLTVNHQLRQSGGFLASMAQTMANTIKWGVASSVMNNFTGTVKKAYGYVKHLDSSLNDIRIVTGKSSDEMDKFAVKANKAAQSLGQSTTAYTEAALIYYQQGLGDVDVEARANVTLKAANVTGQTGEEVSEQLTAVWNGYKVSAEESELYIDKLAAVAANSASNLEELSTGMSKVASAANAMGVDVDQLNAQLSTIISVTRQAPESVGTALKTIYARMSDLKLGKTDEDGIGLGDVSGTMESMGIDVLDATGNLRDMGDVIEDVAKKWGTWTEAQQTAMAQAMAGKRQYNNLVALFENWDMYERSKDVSEGSAGTLQKQQDTYMESTAAHLKQLKAEWEDLYDSLIDTDNINGVVDGLTKVVNLTGAWVDGIGGGVNMLAMLGTVAMNVFSRQIATSLTNTILKFQTSKQMAADLRAEMELTNQIDTSKSNSGDLRVLVDMKKQQLAVTQAMNQTEYELVNKMIAEKAALQDQATQLREKTKAAEDYYNKYRNGAGNDLTANSSHEDREKAAEAMRGVSERFTQTAYGGLDDTSKSISSLIAVTINRNKVQSEATQGSAEWAKAETRYKTAINDTKSAITSQVQTMREWISQGKVQGKEVKQLEQVMKNLNEADLNTEKGLRKVKTQLELGHSIIDKTAKKTEEAAAALDNNRRASDENADAVNRLNQRWNTFFQEINLRAQIQNFTTMISKVGQFASAVNMMVNLPDIFNDESLSKGEKFLRLTMAVSTAAPMFINSIMGFQTAYRGLTSSLRDAIAMKELDNVLTAQATAENAILTTQRLKDIGVVQGQSRAEMLENIVDKLGLQIDREKNKELTEHIVKQALDAQVTDEGALATQKQTAMELLNTMEKKRNSASIRKNTLEVIGNTLARIAHNPVLMITLGIIGLLTVATVGLMLKEREQAKRLKEAKKDYEAAADSAAQLANRYKELTSEIKNFKEEISDYQEGIDALKNLDATTEEYKEKIKEVNDEAKNLIETLDLWGQYSYQGGVITFDEGALDKALLLKEQEAAIVERQATVAKIGVNSAKANLDMVEFQNELGSYITIEKIKVDTGSNGGNVNSYAASKIITEQPEFKETNISQNSIKAFGEAMEKVKDENFKNGGSELSDEELIAKSLAEIKDSFLEKGLEEEFKLLEQNLDSELLPALDKVLASLDSVEQANLAYAEEILGLTVRDKYSEDILARATREDGTIDYQLAEQLYQATEGFLADKEVEGKTIKEHTAEKANEMAEKQREVVNNEDEVDLEALIEAAGGIDAFKAAYKDAFDTDYVEGTKLSSADLATLYYRSQGYEDVNVTDEKDGKLAVTYTKDGKRETESDFTNQEAQNRFWNVMTDAVVAKVQSDLIDKSGSSVEGVWDQVENVGPSQFGASEEQMRQFYVDMQKNNGSLEGLSVLFPTLSQSEVNSLKDKSPEEVLKFFGLTKEMVNTAGGYSAEAFKDAAIGYLTTNYSVEEAFAAANSQGDALAEKYELDTETFKRYREAIREANEELSPDAVNERAIADMRMEKGVESLSGKWKEYKKTLESTKSTEFELAQVQGEMEDALQNILNLSDEDFALLPPNFAKDNIKEINDVMNGVEGSVQTLRSKMQDAWGDEYVLEINPKLKDDTELFGEIQSLQDKILSYNTANFEIGVALKEEDQRELYKAFNEIVANAGMTAEEATRYFKQLGYDIEIKEEEFESEDFVEVPVGSFLDSKAGGAGAFLPDAVKAQKIPLRKKLSAFSMKVITPNGSYGGGVGYNGTPSSSSTSKGSGGGGSSEPKKMEKDKSSIDRYHDVENALKKITTQLERQERIASKLTGKDRIAAIQKQISLLDKQNEKQKEKLNLMKDESEELKKKLGKEGIDFDKDDGSVDNYAAALKAKEDHINNLIDQYNGMSAEEQEKFEETIDKAKEDYEQFKEDLSRYEELLLDEIPGLEDEIQEALDQQIELQIEAFEIEIKLKLDLQDTKRQLNEFMREVIEGIEDDEYGKIQEYIAKDLPTYFGETGIAQANYDALQKALKEYQTIKNGGIGEIFGDDANAAWEKVMELKDATLDSLSEVKDLIDQMEENYLSAIEAASEKFAEHLEQYEHIQSILDHNIKLIEMLAGDEAYDAQLAYYNQMELNNLGQVDMARRDLEFWRQQKAAAEEGSKAWEEANAKEQEAQEQLNALVEQSVETIKTKYEKTVSKIIKDLNNAVTSGKGLDALSQEWELINKEADMYLDTVNSAYEVQKLENKMIDAIDNASSLKAKQRLNELMEKELGMLKDKDKLSQYEVDRANQLLDIEMKKIALEEAQRNKSTMRLRRDAQGNYSYQYVTDNDAVAKAQEELNEAQNSLFNLDKDAYKENLDQILSLWTDFQTKLNEIWTNNNLTDEQKQQQAYELRERYMRMISGLTQDNENIRLNLETSTFSELARLRNMDVQDFQNMADEQKKILLEQVIPQWSSGLQSLAEQFKDENGFTSLMNQAFKDLQTNLANYQKSLKDLEKNAGIKFEKIISGAEDYSKEIQNLINKNKTIVNDQSEILKGIRDSIDATKEWVEEFNKLAKAAKETLDTIIQIQEKENKKDTSNADSSKNNKSEDKKDSSSNKDNSSGGDGKLTTGETVTYTGGPYYETSDGGGKSDSRGPGKKVTVTRISKGEKYPIQVKSDDSASGWLKEDQLTGYGTGGYTGDWSSRDGRLAVLHEKELVLNKQDTQNILAAVDMVRSLNNSLTSRIANLFNNSSVDKLIQLFEKDSAPLEQNVQITASFPNVSAEREIEEAFNSLISSASQYAFNTLK